MIRAVRRCLGACAGAAALSIAFGACDRQGGGSELADEIRALRLAMQERAVAREAAPAAGQVTAALSPLREALAELVQTQRTLAERQVQLGGELQRWSQLLVDDANEERANEARALTERLAAIEATMREQDERHREVEALLTGALDRTASQLESFLTRVAAVGDGARGDPAQAALAPDRDVTARGAADGDGEGETERRNGAAAPPDPARGDDRSAAAKPDDPNPGDSNPGDPTPTSATEPERGSGDARAGPEPEAEPEAESRPERRAEPGADPGGGERRARLHWVWWCLPLGAVLAGLLLVWRQARPRPLDTEPLPVVVPAHDPDVGVGNDEVEPFRYGLFSEPVHAAPPGSSPSAGLEPPEPDDVLRFGSSAPLKLDTSKVAPDDEALEPDEPTFEAEHGHRAQEDAEDPFGDEPFLGDRENPEPVPQPTSDRERAAEQTPPAGEVDEIWAAAALLGEAIGRLRQSADPGALAEFPGLPPLPSPPATERSEPLPAAVEVDAEPHEPSRAFATAVEAAPTEDARPASGQWPGQGPEQGAANVEPVAAEPHTIDTTDAAHAATSPHDPGPARIRCRLPCGDDPAARERVLAVLDGDPRVLVQPPPAVLASAGLLEVSFVLLPGLPAGEQSLLEQRLRDAVA